MAAAVLAAVTSRLQRDGRLRVAADGAGAVERPPRKTLALRDANYAGTRSMEVA